MNMTFCKKDKMNVWIIVLYYCFYTYFFNSAFIMNIPMYGNLIVISNLLICAFVLPYAIRHHKDIVSRQVWILCSLFFFALVWGWLYWGESMYYGLKTTFKAQGVFTLLFFFVYKKYQVSYNALIRAIFTIAIIYSICYLIGAMTFPNQLFGASLILEDAVMEKVLEDRGVLRLLMQGADFIIIAIFYLLVIYRKKKIYYLWLIPLFVMLVFRGTRTPLFVTLLICLIYYLKNIKNKFISVSLLIVAVLAFNTIYTTLLDSNSENPIVKYVQITNDQIENSNEGEEDIRLQMSRYMLTELNADNPICIFIGNGIPRYGEFQSQLTALADSNAFWVVDVGLIVIYVYFGIVGVIIYLGLLIMIIKLQVDTKYYFAKLYLFYLYLILPTNCSLITLSSFMVALTLYVLYLGNKETTLNKMIYETKLQTNKSYELFSQSKGQI